MHMLSVFVASKRPSSAEWKPTALCLSTTQVCRGEASSRSFKTAPFSTCYQHPSYLKRDRNSQARELARRWALSALRAQDREDPRAVC